MISVSAGEVLSGARRPHLLSNLATIFPLPLTMYGGGKNWARCEEKQSRAASKMCKKGVANG